jgi:rhodanese-related sulfurtransferase
MLAPLWKERPRFMSDLDLLGKAALIVCLGAGIAAVHSSFKPRFPIILKGDTVGPVKGGQQPAAPPTPETVPNSAAVDASPAGQTSTAGTSTAAAASATRAPSPELKDFEIDVPTAFSYFQQGKAFIDSRHLPEFEAGHVKNAYQLSADELLSGKAGDWFMALDRSDVVVIYCGGGDCDASHNLRNYMVASFQFQNCLIMHDGWPGWVKAGHPSDQGPPQFGNNP